MPELPEVEITRRGIAGAITGQVVTSVVVREPRLRYPVPPGLAETLHQQRVAAVNRRAKYLLLESAPGALMVHLGMSGSLRVLPLDAPVRKHDHVDIQFGDRLLRLHDPRRFGAVLWVPRPVHLHPLLSKLGPEPLTEDFDAAYLYAASRKRATPIKLFIMDAAVVVGVGNIYASESLFRAGIRPATAAGSLSLPRCERLVTAIKATLADALDAGGSTLRDFVSSSGQAGYFQQQYGVYGRADEACRRCGGLVKRTVMGQRSTFFCPRCQR